jgi:hypothetical protein
MRFFKTSQKTTSGVSVILLAGFNVVFQLFQENLRMFSSQIWKQNLNQEP